jgi:ABC-type transporter Mla subunit MlaD
MEFLLSGVDWASFRSALEAFDSAELGKSVATIVLTRGFISIWCGLIILYFVMCLMFLARGAISLRWALRIVHRALASINGQHGFTQGFETYDQVVRSRRRLVHPWKEFVESLVLPESGSDAPIQNTGEVSQYLNDDTVIAPHISTIFYHSVPNHLTGAGILGTFLGLAAGVGLASSGLASGGSPTEVMKSLQQLLGGASLAFFTSIFGITCSLIFLVTERLTLSGLRGALERWVSGLESRLREVTPESIALKQLREAERQTKQLEHFNNDLVFALEQALEEKIAGRLAPQLETLIQTVEGLRADRSTDSSKAIEEMIGHFTQALQDRTGTQFDAMSSTVGDLDRSLKASADAMQRTQVEVRQVLDSIMDTVRSTLESSASTVQEKLSQSLEDVGRTMKSSSENLAQQLGGSSAAAAEQLRDTLDAVTQELARTGTDAASQIAASLQGFQTGVERLEQSSRTSERLLTGMNQFVDQLNTLRGTIESTHRQIAEIVEPVRSAASDIRASSERATNALRGTIDLVGRIEAALEELGQQQDAIAAAWNRYQARFEGIDQSLQNVFGLLDDGLSRYAEQVTEFVKELDRNTSSIVQNIASATSELQGAIEDLLEGLPRSKP